jgi:HIV Tat-specific factor 1
LPPEQDNGSNNGRTKNNKRQAREAPAPRQNTAIYVTGLPLDATAEEVHDLFSRKCGVIAEEIDSGRPRIKMYTDDKGQFKGDALVVFFKPQSVEMAVMLLDDSDFRVSSSDGLSAGRMRVMPADSSYKKTNNESGSNAHVAGPGGNKNRVITGEGQSGEGEGSSSTNAGLTDHTNAGSTDHTRHKQNHQDRQKIIRKTQKLTAKLADWDDDEASSLPTGRPGVPDVKGSSKRWDKVVILTHMFTLQELEEDLAALRDIEEDIRDECAKLGEVTNVVLFDQEDEGIVSVKFDTPEAAEACVRLMHGRSFDGRTVEAYFATGRERFRKSKKSGGGEEEDDAEG